MPWLETPLGPKSPCIRILKLHPGANGSPIACTLRVVSLDDNPEYETLSYVWGDPKKTKPIHCRWCYLQCDRQLSRLLRLLAATNRRSASLG